MIVFGKGQESEALIPRTSSSQLWLRQLSSTDDFTISSVLCVWRQLNPILLLHTMWNPPLWKYALIVAKLPSAYKTEPSD